MAVTSTDRLEDPQLSPDAHGRLTSSEAAAILQVSQATVTRMDRKRLPYTSTPGGHRRYRPEDVERCKEWLENGEPEAQS